MQRSDMEDSPWEEGLTAKEELIGILEIMTF